MGVVIGWKEANELPQPGVETCQLNEQHLLQKDEQSADQRDNDSVHLNELVMSQIAHQISACQEDMINHSCQFIRHEKALMKQLVGKLFRTDSNRSEFVISMEIETGHEKSNFFLKLQQMGLF